MAISSTNISMSAINSEVSSVSSTNLRILSVNANEYSGYTLLNDSPYGMNEFAGYSHGPPTHNISWASWSSPGGKISFQSTIGESGTNVPFGSYQWDQLSISESSGGAFVIYWTTARNDSWTHLTLGSYTAYRTSATSTTSTTHRFTGLTTANKNAIKGATSGVFQY